MSAQTRTHRGQSPIPIRERLRPGDIGWITWLHGTNYSREYRHGISFEAYVAEGLAEFRHRFDPTLDRVWIAEDGDHMVGTLFLMHRPEGAQLRYFLVLPEWRGRGLGKELMMRYMDALGECGYRHSYLWTTHELAAAASLYMRHGFVLTEQQPSTRFGKELVEQKYEWHRPSGTGNPPDD